MSPHDQVYFAQLRTLLFEEPAQRIFDIILTLFHNWEDSPERDVGIQYAENHLQSWPDEFRQARPEDCWRVFPSGNPSPSFRLIRHLHFSPTEFRADEARKLVHTPYLQHVKSLTLASNRIQADGIKIFMDSPYLAYLEELDLDYNEIGDEGALHIAQSPHMSRLKHLNLNSNGLTKEGIESLMHSPYIRGLETLHVNNNNIGPDGARCIAKTAASMNYKELHLAGNAIAEGLEALANTPALSPLNTLILDYNHIEHRCAGALAHSPHIRHLQVLSMNRTHLRA